MRHKKIIVIGLFILLLLDLGLAYQSYQNGKTPGYETVVVKRGDIAEKISVTGTAQPASSLDLQFTSSGKVNDVRVKVGDNVKAGQVLVSLDTSDLNFQAQAQAAALQSAQARLEQLLAGASQEDIALAQTAVANAEKSLEDAKKSLKDSEDSAKNSLFGVFQSWQRTLQASYLTAQNSIKTNYDTLYSPKINNSSSISDLQALIDAKDLHWSVENEYNATKTFIDSALSQTNESDIAIASTKLNSVLFLLVSSMSRTYDALNSAIISPSFFQTELDAFKASIVAARTNANTALTNTVSSEQAVSSQKTINQANLTAAQTKVTVAEGTLNSAKDQLILKLVKPRQVDIDLKQAEIAQAQASLNQIKNQIAQKILVAPIEGVITAVGIEKGEIASLGKTIVSMASLSDFEIKSDIAESDIAKVKIGNSVSITFDAFGESETFSGKVVKIDPAQTVISGIVYYRTTVGFDSSSGKIKSGMTANLDIETSRHENALILPLRAISDNGAEKKVKYLDGDKIAEKMVEAGIKSDQGEIEILSGVGEGEKIVIETK